MSVSASDIFLYKSSSGASAGGGVTGTVITNATGDLFASLSDAERAAGGTRYKKWFLGNDHATDNLLTPKIWISQSPTGFNADQIGVGFDDADDATSGMGTLTAFSGNAVVGLVSSIADTRTAKLVGLSSLSVPIIEDVVLTGTVEVLSLATFSKLYAVKMSAESGSAVVTIRQGAGGTTRGTIPINEEATWLWITANSEGSSIQLPNLSAGGRYGFWHKQVWPAATAAQRPNKSQVAVKEGA